MHHSWTLYLKRGKDHLLQHRPQDAVHCFERALHNCPVEETATLSDILYLCGIALNKLGQTESARECWRSSASINPAGTAAALLNRAKDVQDEPDWRVFRAVQVSRYFSFKRKKVFYSENERRKVMHIIRTYWDELVASGLLDELRHDERLDLYTEVEIDYNGIFCNPASHEYSNIVSLMVCHIDMDTPKA